MSESKENAQQAESVALEGEGDLLSQIMTETRIKPTDEGYSIAKRGVEALIAEMLAPNNQGEKVNKSIVDQMIAGIDEKLSVQVDEILHHKDVQKLESAWRGLKYVVDKTNFRENIKLELLSVSKDELLEDFEDSPEVVKSGLYQHCYVSEYGQFGGNPIGAMIANYDFGPGPQDVKLLQYAASVSAMSHAPFIAAAGPEFFGIDDYQDLPGLKDLDSLFEGPQYTKWRSFRESEDARYVGLTAPRFLLRLPYGEDSSPVKAFNYEENVKDKHDAYLWGNTSFAFATRLADSFAKYRWCPNIIGPQSGGAVEDLPLHTFDSMGDIETKTPTEVLVSDRREYEMSEQGFISLTMRKGSDQAAFFAANSCQKPKFFGNSVEGKAAETNYKLGAQLPYLFVTCRLAHYIKVLQREQIGSWKEKSDLNRELNTWIKQFVSDQDNPSSEVRGRRPLRAASIEVNDVDGDPGFYKVSMSVRPHFKYMGASFDLSLVGKLDKS
jgi:type VI secretion system protein ImpC